MKPITDFPDHLEHFHHNNRTVAVRPYDTLELTFSVFDHEHAQHVQTYPDKRSALRAINLFLLSAFLVDGYGFDSWINQQVRECQVVDIKRTRFRIWFQMPNCEQYGWRHYRSIGPWDFLPFWEEARYQDLNQPGAIYAKWIY